MANKTGENNEEMVTEEEVTKPITPWWRLLAWPKRR